jgi:meiotic recombination protein SPO11
VVASEKGVVVGRLSFREDGDFIDCRRMGVGGKAIPPNIDKARARARRGAARPPQRV